MTPPRSRTTWALPDEAPPPRFHVVSSAAPRLLAARSEGGVGPGMAGTPSGGEWHQGGLAGCKELAAWRRKGPPGACGRKNGRSQRQDLRREYFPRGRDFGLREGMGWGKLPVEGRAPPGIGSVEVGVPLGNRQERRGRVRGLRRSGGRDQWADGRPGGLDPRGSVSRLPFPLLQVLLCSPVPPTLPRRPQLQSPLVSLWRC